MSFAVCFGHMLPNYSIGHQHGSSLIILHAAYWPETQELLDSMVMQLPDSMLKTRIFAVFGVTVSFSDKNSLLGKQTEQ